MNQQATTPQGYTAEYVKERGVQVIGRFKGLSRKGWLLKGYDFVEKTAMTQPEVFGCGEAGIFKREIWDPAIANQLDQDYHAKEKALYDSIPLQSREPRFAAQDLFGRQTPKSKAVTRELLALIGERALEGETPFDFSNGPSVGLLRGWIGGADREFHVMLWVRPDDFEVQFEVSHRYSAVTGRLLIPGEIVGLHRDEGYRGVHFSTERCNRQSNLFNLLDFAAIVLVELMGLVQKKSQEKQRSLAAKA